MRFCTKKAARERYVLRVSIFWEHKFRTRAREAALPPIPYVPPVRGVASLVRRAGV